MMYCLMIYYLLFRKAPDIETFSFIVIKQNASKYYNWKNIQGIGLKFHIHIMLMYNNKPTENHTNWLRSVSAIKR